MIQLDTIYNEDCMIGMKEIPDGTVDLILSDLPFGISAHKWDSILPLDDLFAEYKRILKRGGVIILFCVMTFAVKLIAACPDWYKYDLVWLKTHGTDFFNAKRKPLQAHENILVFSNTQNMTYNPQYGQGKPYDAKPIKKSDSKGYRIARKLTLGSPDGKRYPLSYVKFAKEQTVKGNMHPTQKPAALLEWLIRTYSNPGDTVLDNCCGSGSTLVAAKKLRRHYIGYEIDEMYYNMAKKNLKKADVVQITMFDEV